MDGVQPSAKVLSTPFHFAVREEVSARLGSAPDSRSASTQSTSPRQAHMWRAVVPAASTASTWTCGEVRRRPSAGAENAR